jgi:hypothetical protein
MTTSNIDRLFEIIPERRQFIGGLVAGYVVRVGTANGSNYFASIDGYTITNQGARDLAAALLAAADAAEAAS